MTHSNKDNSISQKNLPPHEWLIITLVIIVLTTLTAVSYFFGDQLPKPTSEPVFIAPQELEIVVLGEVHNPGKHIVPRGALVQDVLDIAVPTAQADLSKIKRSSKVRRGQVIKVRSIDKGRGPSDSR